MNWKKKKRINNSCIGAIHGFLLWNLSASHHLSVLHILFSVEDVVILELNNTIFCQHAITACLKKVGVGKFKEDAGSQKTIILLFEILPDMLLKFYCLLQLYSEIL